MEFQRTVKGCRYVVPAAFFEGKNMEIKTVYFGKIEYTEEELIIFADGLFGFEKSHRFLPVSFKQEKDTLICLQNVEEENLAFIAVNPFHFYPDYTPELSEQDYDRLGTRKKEEISFYTLCIAGDRPEEWKTNLRCPIAVNTVTRKAIQAILEDASYSFHQSFGFDLVEGEGIC